jgi:hypothetical protein
MNLTSEKEKIKKEIDLIDDARVIKAIKKVLAEYDADEDLPVSMVNEAPLTDEEMAVPGGRMPTKAQIEEWLDRDEDDEFLSGEEALAYSLKLFEEYRAKKNGK